MTSSPESTPAVVTELFRDTTVVNRYVDLLSSRGVDRGLVGPREVDRIWERHIFNSVALRDLIPSGSQVVDVGSGAGLPGLPLAMARPDLDVTLLEPLLRRSDFLTEVVDELGLAGRVHVVRVRAEDHRARYDVVTARAVASTQQLLTWCSPLMLSAGVMLLLKGGRALEELATADSELKRRRLRAEVLTVRAHSTTEPTRVIRVGHA